jgi:DNA-binding NarL/FixJ family response regulator
VVAEFEAKGWLVLEGFDLEGARSTRAIRAGRIAAPEDAKAAILVAARGAGLIVHLLGSEATSAGLFDDLRRIGIVEFRGAGTPTPEREPRTAAGSALDEDQLTILRLLGEGMTVSSAAKRLHLSRRTAERRLAKARLVLGVGTTAEAVFLVRRSD